MEQRETICAIATPGGTGAIAVIRLSGRDAIAIGDFIFTPVQSGKSLHDQKANTIHYGSIKDNDKLIDEVLISVFKAPRSYTGEDVLEISCHGSPFIQQRILQLLIHNGARMASPGEFTMRAFLNGKMDLSQAEGVADLISSSSEAAHKMALQQMRGGFSKEIKHLRDQLLHFTSLIELELDFSDEDVEFADRQHLRNLLEQIDQKIKRLAESFSAGNVIKHGVPVTIIGSPNVGKSTLLNALLNEERAIVSEIEGTTRDVIEDVITIEGIAFRFIDTAGLRKTKDKIETVGIQKAREKIEKASLVLYIIDATKSTEQINAYISELKEILTEHPKNIIYLVNKIDSVEKQKLDDITPHNIPSLSTDDTIIHISAKSMTNIDQVADALVQSQHLEQYMQQDLIVTNARHYEALSNAAEAIYRVTKGLDSELPGDLLAQDIRQALHYLGEITGEITTNEVLEHIFSHFCIGK